jgi:3-oxoacyl-[acyl-carrier protein] reductase
MGTFIFAGASSKIAIKTAETLKVNGHDVIGISTKDQIEPYDQHYRVSSYIESEYPKIEQPISGLVYFPGTINLKPFGRITPAEFVNDYYTNCLGAVVFVQTYLPLLKQVPGSSIVLISSVAANIGMPFHTSIAMAKGAVESLTKSLSAELAPNIRVNCVAPSLTDTPLGEKFLNTSDKVDAAMKRNPMKKVGLPEDIANAITFLLSEKSSWITGQVLPVDGGMGALKI